MRSRTTRWISDPELLKWKRPKLGYRSLPAKDVAEPKWVQFDLGAAMPVETVRVRAVMHTVDERLGFPRRFQLQVADRADFSDARMVMAVSMPLPSTEAGNASLSGPTTAVMCDV